MTEPPTISFTTKELFVQIQDKLDKVAATLELKADRTAVHEVKSDIAALKLGKADLADLRELTNRLGRVEHYAEILPQIIDFMKDMNVKQEVEDALDARRIRGTSVRDKVIVGGLSACILLVTLLTLLPKAIG